MNIAAEITPNPNTLKFNVGKTLIESGTLNYTDKERAKGIALAEKLYEVQDVLGVMIGRDFVTVTKKPEASWHTMAQPIIDSLKVLIASGQELVPAGLAGVAPAAEAGVSANGEIERKIREILDAEIRPAVAMDGGDIQFYGYDNGVVTLHLQGSCSSCPSSVMTLKMGVENRLKSLIPEVREVVQV